MPTIAAIDSMGESGDNDKGCSTGPSVCECALSDAYCALHSDGLSTIVPTADVLEACAKIDSFTGRQ